MDFTTSQQNFKNNPIVQAVLAEKCPTRIKLLRSFFAKFWKYSDIFPSQTCLAHEAGVVRETANRQLAVLDDLNWIEKTRRYNTTCVYKINPVLIEARHLLWDKFPVLKTVSIFLLGSSINGLLGGTVTSRYNNLIKTPAPRWNIRQLAKPDYGFYEPRPSKKQSIPYFLINNTTVTVQQPLKERNMDNNPSLSFIASTFGLSEQQLDMLSNYSEAALQYALKEMARQKAKPNAPANWIASVARSFEQKVQHTKMGKAINAGSSNSFNANHSPSIARPNAFKDNYDVASAYTEGEHYEERFDIISQDKTDPEGYKLMVRRYDYRRIAR